MQLVYNCAFKWRYVGCNASYLIFHTINTLNIVRDGTATVPVAVFVRAFFHQ
jgi:hypothetical protein